MARKAANAKPFIGDQILAVYQALTSCCCLSLTSFLGAASLGFAAKPSLIAKFQKEHPSEVWGVLKDPHYTPPIGILLLLNHHPRHLVDIRHLAWTPMGDLAAPSL